MNVSAFRLNGFAGFRTRFLDWRVSLLIILFTGLSLLLPLIGGEIAVTPAPVQDEPEEVAPLIPIPNLTGSLWDRDVLTGDWWGHRQSWAERGLHFEFDLYQYYQGLIDGGIDHRWDYSGTSDYRIKLDTGRAGLWPGAILEIHGESYWGKSANNADGAILPANTDYLLQLPEGNGHYLSHVTLTQFLSESMAVIVGKLDTTIGDSNLFAHLSGNQRFMNMAFSFNPVTVLSAPYSTLGAAFLWLPNDKLTLTVSVYDSDGDLTETGFDTVFSGGTGYNAELKFNTQMFDMPGHHLFGATYAAGPFSLLNDPRLLLPDFAGQAEIKNETWALYYNFDQYLSYDSETDTGWGAFGRVGVADKQTNPIDLFFSAGVGGQGLFDARPQDHFGIGYFYARFSDDLPRLLQNRMRDEEHGLEVFYNAAITPWFNITADLQVISPGLRVAETATVFGLRAGVRF